MTPRRDVSGKDPLVCRALADSASADNRGSRTLLPEVVNTCHMRVHARRSKFNNRILSQPDSRRSRRKSLRTLPLCEPCVNYPFATRPSARRGSEREQRNRESLRT
jgi:hypothetical protein